MRKTRVLLIQFAFIFVLAGCESTPKAEKTVVESAAVSSVQTVNKASSDPEPRNQVKEKNQKKERYSDWQYKGFGEELPKWVDFAVEQNIEGVKKSLKMKDWELEILSATGKNVDQAEKKLADLEKESGCFEVVDKIWVKLNNESVLENYLALKIIIKK